MTLHKKHAIHRQLLVWFVLLTVFAGQLKADSLTLPFTSAATIDGSATEARFLLTLESASATNRLSTQQLMDISVSFTPDVGNREQKGSVYAVFVKNNHYFLLRPDRSFTPWDGEIATLLPFAVDVTLSETTLVQLLTGRLSDPGEYQIFVAYSAQNLPVLKFTPEPAVLLVNPAEQSPEMEEAARLFQSNVESRIVQSRCIV